MQEVVIIAPTIMPVSRRVRYGGVESLAFEFVSGLSQANGAYSVVPSNVYQAPHAPPPRVSIICTDASQIPDGVERIAVGGPTGFDEPGITSALIAMRLQGKTDDPEVGWIDFSHSHQLGRLFPDVPHITPIWYDPKMMHPEEPRSNIACLSRWQRRRFEQVFGQEARIIDPICVNPEFYSEGGPQEERMVFIGKMHPHKGALEAVRECQRANIKLDVIGASGPGDDPRYAEQVREECDGTDTVFYGEVDHEAKRELTQRAGALFYPVSYPDGYGEAHSHKMAEAMMCGTPCIAYDQGAMKEIVDERTGFIVSRTTRMLSNVEVAAMNGEIDPASGRLTRRTSSLLNDLFQSCLGMDRHRVRRHAIERFSTASVVDRWLGALRQVCAEGRRW